MEKEFIPYEQALALKELGFNEPCFSYIKHLRYDSSKEKVKILSEVTRSQIEDMGLPLLKIPTFSQAFRWFREKYNLFGHVLAIKERNYEWRIQNIKYLQDRRHFTLADIGGGQIGNTYEEAELECLKKLIEIVKNK